MPSVAKPPSARYPYSVVGLGAMNVDLIAEGKSTAEDSEHQRPRGEILEIFRTRDLEPKAYLGGSAYNAMLMIGQLKEDLRLAMIGVAGSVASDGLRVDHVEALARQHIDFLGQDRPQIAGTCGSVSAPGGGRELWTDPGVNTSIEDVLTPELQDAISGCRVLHVTSLLEPIGSHQDDVAQAVAGFIEEFRACNRSCLVTLDPGEPWSRARNLPAVRAIYSMADLLFVNRQEFKILTGGSVDSPAAVRRLIELCPRALVHILKHHDGVSVRHCSGITVANLRRQSGTSVDTTGAGDAVAAGVLAALGSGRSVVEGTRLGLAIAQYRVSALGDEGHQRLHAAIPDPWGDDLPDPTLRGWARLVQFAREAEPVAKAAMAMTGLLGVIVGAAATALGLLR